MREADRAEGGLSIDKQKCSCSCGDSIASLQDEFFGKLKNFLLDIFSMILKRVNPTSRSLLADGAIRNNFGVDMTNPAIHKKDKTIESDDTGKKLPLNSTDEFLSDNDDVAGVLSLLPSLVCT